MAKRKVKFIYDAPVTLTFSLVCIVVFLIDTFLLKNYLAQHILLSPTSGSGLMPFSFSDPVSYPRLILYVFGSESITLLLANLVLILLLGPFVEEYYGSVVVGIMMAVSILFSGVINACFCVTSLQGPTVIVFMMIFLNGFIAISKKKLPLSFIVVCLMIIAFGWLENKPAGIASSLVTVLINVAGGLCGSLIACLASPKARATKRNNDKIEEIDNGSPRKKTASKTSRRKPAAEKNNDETIVGPASDTDETVIGPVDL